MMKILFIDPMMTMKFFFLKGENVTLKKHWLLNLNSNLSVINYFTVHMYPMSCILFSRKEI